MAGKTATKPPSREFNFLFYFTSTVSKYEWGHINVQFISIIKVSSNEGIKEWQLIQNWKRKTLNREVDLVRKLKLSSQKKNPDPCFTGKSYKYLKH